MSSSETQAAGESTTECLSTKCVSSELREDDTISVQAEDLHMRIIYLIIGILGMLGNAFVAIVILLCRSMRRTHTNMFIINQCLIDFTASFFIITTTYIHDTSLVHGELNQELFCRLWMTNLPLWGIFVSSTYNLVAVTFERYFAIVHPLHHSHRFTKRKLYVVMVAIWLLGLAYNAAYMVPSSDMKGDSCTVFTEWPSETWRNLGGITTVVVQYFIPLGLIGYAYARMALALKAARYSQPPVRTMPVILTLSAGLLRYDRLTRARQNVIKTLALVSACFVFCWSWNQIYYITFNLGYKTNLTGSFYHFTVVLVFCNCCINPVVYALKYEHFQRAVKCLFCPTKPGNSHYRCGSLSGTASVGATYRQPESLRIWS